MRPVRLLVTLSLLVVASVAALPAAPAHAADDFVAEAYRIHDLELWKGNEPYLGGNQHFYDDLVEFGRKCRATVKALARARRPADAVFYGDTKVGGVAAVCDEFERKLAWFRLATILQRGEQAQRIVASGPSDNDRSSLNAETAQAFRDDGAACLKALAEVQAQPGPVTSVAYASTTYPLADAPAMCAALPAAADVLAALYQQKHDEIAAKYKAVGIKGDRLELFIYYDYIEWYLPGCQDSTDEPARLKKAKALFQWLTDGDGNITVRKFTFSGDKYKRSEKRFASYQEAAAYRACH